MARLWVVFFFFFIFFFCLSVSVVQGSDVNPCAALNKTDSCTILGQSVSFEGSIVLEYYEFSLTNSTLSCLSDLCSVTIRASSAISLLKASMINASIVRLYSDSLSIDDTSVLNVTGRGYVKGPGSPADFNYAGASFGGRGASQAASAASVAYGNLTLVQEELNETMGSGAGGAGGGCIRVEANDILIDGMLLADGVSDKHASGGSGGSISIRSLGDIINPSLSIRGNGYLSASAAVPSSLQYGSGGGRIYLASDNTNFSIEAFGGCTFKDFCGAAGTILLFNGSHGCPGTNRTVTTTLVVSSPSCGIAPSTGTPLLIEDAENAAIDILKVSGGSVLWVDTSAYDALRISYRVILDNSAKITADEFVRIGSKSIELMGDSSIVSRDIVLIVASLATSSGSQLTAESRIHVIATADLSITGSVTASSTKQASIWLKAPVIKISQTSKFEAYKISLIAHASIYIRDAVIRSKASSCLSDLHFNATSMPVQSTYTLYMRAQFVLLWSAAAVYGARVYISANLLQILGTLDASGLGCAPNQGISPGVVEGQCGYSGGSHGGVGGNGGQKLLHHRCNDTFNPSTFDNETFPALEGAGGASGSAADGGLSGGGVIHIVTQSTMIHGTIAADGETAAKDDTNLQISGGAGGSIFLKTTFIYNNGTLSAVGSDAVGNGNGGGGGGRVSLFLTTGNYSATGWIGTVNVSGGAGTPHPTIPAWDGKAGQDGTVVSNARCPAGSAGLFCSPCPIGTYKSVVGQQLCVACYNGPEHSLYTLSGVDVEECPYKCEPDFGSVEDNPMCLGKFDRFLHSIGGVGGFVSIILAALFVVCLLVLVRKHCIQRSEMNKKLYGHLPSSDQDVHFKRADAVPLLSSTRSLVAQDIKPEFGSEDLPYHLHRIYLLGDNCYFRPWGLPQHPPPAIADLFILDAYSQFVSTFNELSSWQLWEHVVWVVLTYLYCPLAYAWLWYRKSLRSEWLRHFISTGEHCFWRSLRARNISNSIKFTFSPEHTLAYLDILDYDASLMDWTGKPSLPLVASLAGDGSFFWPFQLPRGDPLLESIALYTGKRTFEEFFDNFNALSRTVCSPWNGPGPVKTVQRLATYLAEANEQYFKCTGLGVSLCVFKACCNSSSGQVNSESTTVSIALCDQRTESRIVPSLSEHKGELMCVLDSVALTDESFWHDFKLGVVIRDLRDEVQIVLSCSTDNVEADEDEPDFTMLTTTACATSPLPWLVAGRFSRQSSSTNIPATFRGSPRLMHISRTPRRSAPSIYGEDLRWIADLTEEKFARASAIVNSDSSPFSFHRTSPSSLDSSARARRTSLQLSPQNTQDLCSVHSNESNVEQTPKQLSFVQTVYKMLKNIFFLLFFRSSYLLLRSVRPRVKSKRLLLFGVACCMFTEMMLLSFILADYHSEEDSQATIFYLTIFLMPLANFLGAGLCIFWVMFQSPRIGRLYQAFNALSLVNCLVPFCFEVFVSQSQIGQAFGLLLVKIVCIQGSNYVQAAVEYSKSLHYQSVEVDHVEDRAQQLLKLDVESETYSDMRKFLSI